MKIRMTWLAITFASLTGCAGEPFFGDNAADRQAKSQIAGAAQAVALGLYPEAERQLAPYVYRDDSERLKLKFFGVSGENRKLLADTVVTLLWETGRDDTLQQFSEEYLSGLERTTVRCRLSERRALYEAAYHCWNDSGQTDRAERVIRTEAALRILGSP